MSLDERDGMISEEKIGQLLAGVTEFPEYRVHFFQSGNPAPQFVDSIGGRALIEADKGDSFHYFGITPKAGRQFSVKYGCVFKLATNEGGIGEPDDQATGTDGQDCPSIAPMTKSRYIKRISAELIYPPTSPERRFRLSYRVWISEYNNPSRRDIEPDPNYWVGGGMDCGTARDNFWITAMEFLASPA